MANTVFGLAPFTVVGLVVATVLAVLVARSLRNRQLTKYHVPAVILLLLGVTTAFGSVVAFEGGNREVTEYEYTVDTERPPEIQSAQSQETPSETPVTSTPELTTAYPGEEAGGPYEFDELSPDAQDVFLSALRSDGSYTTRTDPPDFQDYTPDDTGGPGYVFIQYNSTWYKMTIVGPGLGAGWGYAYIFGIGVLLTVTILAVGWASITLPSFKIPVSVLVGLGGFITVTILGGSIPVTILATGRQSAIPGWSFIGVTLLIWLILRLFERQRQQSFRERMTTTDDR